MQVANNPKVLIAEDDADDRFFLSHSFKKLRFDDFWFVNNGRLLVEHLSFIQNAAYLPSLIVLDLRMPELGGKETLQRIKSVDTLKHIPVIIVSDGISVSQAENFMEMGAYACYSKPVNPEEYDLITEKIIFHLEESALEYQSKVV